MTKIELEDGKYTVTYNKGELKALRYGEPWREMIGDKLMYAMFCRIQELESDIDQLCSSLERIEAWNSHTSAFSIDYGSNGVRDLYRGIARESLSKVISK